MDPVVLHVIRPYASEEEFLEAEAWTIEARGMLLVDQRELEPNTLVVFDVGLSNGVKMMRAEARVLGYLAPSEEFPGGLRVRFRRYGSQTKAFIERALSVREAQLARAEHASSLPPRSGPAPEPAPTEASPVAGSTAEAPTPGASSPAETTAAERAAVEGPAPVAPEPAPETTATAEAPSQEGPREAEPSGAESPVRLTPASVRPIATPQTRPFQEPSGIHRRLARTVPAPANRDELLERLRQRARALESITSEVKSGTE